MSGRLIELYGWPFVFYLFGGIGFAWCVVWQLVVPRTGPLRDA